MPKSFCKWKVGTVNIRTGKDDQKLEQVVHEIDKAGLTICGLQEVRRLKTGSALIPVEVDNNTTKYEVYWSGNLLKRQHGVGVVVKVDPNIEITQVNPVNSRIIVLDTRVYGCSLRIICCYAPTEESTVTAKNSFYNDLNKQFLSMTNKQKVICLGDFNATSSATWHNSSLRESSIIENLVVNNNGERFHEFFQKTKLSVLNTWFSHRKCRRITWHSADGVTKKVYDFILSCSWLRQYITNCRVYNSFDFDSDHRIVIATINTPCTKLSRYIKRTTKKKPNRLDLSALDNERTESNFIENVAQKLNLVYNNRNGNDTLSKTFVNTIKEVADNILPKQNLDKLHQPWHDDQKLKDLYAKKDVLFAKNGNLKEISALRKKIRLRAKYLKNDHFKKEAQKLNQLAINRELEKLFQRAKKQETTLRTIQSSCPPDKLLKHFKSHFNPVGPNPENKPEELGNNPPNFIAELKRISSSININDLPPTIEEIQQHLRKLKDGVASNDIEPELLKRCNHPIMLEVIHRMTTNLWENLDLPDSWGNSRLKTLWKGKGSKKDPCKYRGVSIGSTVCKLIVNIILERIRPWYEDQLLEEQNGFRKGRGTTDGIYVVKRTQQIINRKKQTLFLLFVDLSAAFDHIPRSWLFDTIKLRFSEGKYPRIFEILETLYQNTSLTYDEASVTFKTSSGVRQGGPESPILFTLFMDFVMRVFIEQSKDIADIDFFEYRYRINSKAITREERVRMRTNVIRPWGNAILPWCGYADDLVLFLQSKNGIQAASNLLDRTFSKFGLSINRSKTETMVVNQSDPDSYDESIISLTGTALKNVKEFKYLGAYLNYLEPNTGDTEINHRIQMANVKFAEMTNVLQNFEINLRTRILFLNSFVRSRLTYGCQNWNLTSYQYDRLDIAYRNFLRRMIRGGFRHIDENNNDYRYVINNLRLHAICGTKDLNIFVKEQQQNYASHVIRMPANRSVKLLTFNDDKYTKRGRVLKSLLDQVVDNGNFTLDNFCNLALSKKFGKST